jgi:hypothetical protein
MKLRDSVLRIFLAMPVVRGIKSLQAVCGCREHVYRETLIKRMGFAVASLWVKALASIHVTFQDENGNSLRCLRHHWGFDPQYSHCNALRRRGLVLPRVT